MFTELVLRTTGFYRTIRNMSPYFDLAITDCEELLIAPSFEKLHNLYNFARFVFSLVETTYYRLHEEIVNLTTLVILQSIQTLNLTGEQSVELITNAMNLNAMMAQMLSMLGLHGESWNYQMRAFDPNWSVAQNQIDLNFTTGFWAVAVKQGVFDIRLQIMESLGNFFYISRHMGHNYSQCHDLYRYICQWIKVGDEEATEADILCVCYYAGILASNPQFEAVEQVCSALKKQYTIESGRNPELSILIAETFATKFGSVAKEDVVEWARTALKTPNVQIHPQQKVSLELNILLNERPLNLHEIKQCIKNFVDDLDFAISDILINDLQKQRLSEFIARVISSAYSLGEYKFIIEIAFFWRTYRLGIEKVIPSSEVLLVTIPNLRDDQVIYLVWNQGVVEHYVQSASISLQELFQRKGTFDGSWIVLLNQEEPQEPQPPLRHPDYDNSDQYLNTLESYFSPKEIATKLNQLYPIKPIRILETTWLNVPLTALIGAYVDLAVSTLVTPQLSPETAIRKVLVWCDPEENLYHAHLEKDAVAHIFRTNGVTVDIVMESQCTKELFIEKYSNPDIDVIWTMCHGNFNSDSPPDSTIGVSKQYGIRLEELIPLMPERINRRLLILNACESGMVPQRSDAMAFIGFGPQLTNNNQSVIGHLWSINTFGAAVFGILLAMRLVSSSSWGEATNKARTDMAIGNIHIIEILSKYLETDSDILRMLSRPSNNPDKIGYWGSAALFE